MKKISGICILPPFAIGRLGSSDTPLENFTIDENPDQPLGFRRIVPRMTLEMDWSTGKIKCSYTPEFIRFRDHERIRPVAPFLEVFAMLEGEENPAPLHEALEGMEPGSYTIEWHVHVANHKVYRRTGDPKDKVEADTGRSPDQPSEEPKCFSDHRPHKLNGYCENFVQPENGKERPHIDFGRVCFVDPTDEFKRIRLRFQPAKGLIYGTDKVLLKDDDHGDGQMKLVQNPLIPEGRAIYDHRKGWYGFGKDPEKIENETVPASLYAIEPPAPPWLHDNLAVSRGYLDDACDGIVEVRLKLKDGTKFEAAGRICSAPPAVVPDSLFVRSLRDDLEQAILGPEVQDEPFEVTRQRAVDILRRAYETVRFMNVVVMNGNDVKGRSALTLDSMPEEEAADTERAIRPVMGPGTVDTLAIMALHEQVFAALRGGAAPWFLDLLRQPDQVADYTDLGRRKMPALMCGADNSYLALTWRQINTIRKAASESLFHSRSDPAVADAPVAPVLVPRNRTAQQRYAQLLYEAEGNPISAHPVTSVANCCPGLEVDFRAVWRRMFKGLVLREYDNLVVDVSDEKLAALKGRRLLCIHIPDGPKGARDIPTMATIRGPAPSDLHGSIVLTTSANPYGLAPLEWSNLLARVLANCQGKTVTCDFSAEPAEIQQPWPSEKMIGMELEVEHFFEDNSTMIARALAQAGELTQGLCSPWQNDYRECSCYYWASARPDFINVHPGPDGLSKGDNWFQKERTGDYVVDDYVDSRLVLYDELFDDWQRWLRFQVGGTDASQSLPLQKPLESGAP